MRHRSKSDGREPVARALGQTFATVQHLTDLSIAWGSRKLKRMGEGPETARTKGIVPLLRRTGRHAARFVGSMGDAYYEWYEKLKSGNGRR